MTPDLIRFTQMVRADPKMKLNSVMGMVFRVDGLRDSFNCQDRRKAVGVDGMTKDEYGKGLEENIQDLSARLRRMGYKPKPVRRVYIPKANGGKRPLGVPSFEDRIVQDRLSQILEAIWEPEFWDCSYGFRPNRSAHDALRRIAEVITNEGTQWVVEADIKGFFDNVDHTYLLKFLEHRVIDKRLLRLMHRFLKSGIMEEGNTIRSEKGTPQGGLVSPILSNIYLHYVLDWWFEGRFKKSCKSVAHLVRYADDYVACFADKDEAERYLKEMRDRLAEFGLEIEPSKTRIVKFGSDNFKNSGKKNHNQPLTFNFLGFTHHATRSRSGRFMVGRSTESKRMRSKLKEVNKKLRALRYKGGQAMTDYLRLHLMGHIQYYGVSGNSRKLKEYSHHAIRHLFKWLNNRSQRRSITWEKFYKLLRKGLMPRPRIIHCLYPKPKWMT